MENFQTDVRVERVDRKILGNELRKRRMEYFFPQVYLNYEGELKDDNMIEMKNKKIKKKANTYLNPVERDKIKLSFCVEGCTSTRMEIEAR